ncbi:hypothetical protein BU16DRAFT_593720 [Lophium mytilinum]|uniref:Uncharacterized protein n=1 Tax=Lophium mytilinum TaxID=390894 RepID=A0A6A6QJQ0_9PEZI|nr:hypothetical protein BU16DRAFT_593720 [Lophium mytilinum]
MDRPLIILPDYLQEEVSHLPNMNELFEMEESVRPCTWGSLYHILRCGHKVRTTTSERCAENCRIFWNETDFAYPRCIEKELRSIIAAGGAMDIPDEDIIEDIKFAIEAEIVASRKRVATTVMYRDPIEDFYRDNFPELVEADTLMETTQMEDVQRKFLRTSARAQPWNPEIWQRYHRNHVADAPNPTRRYTLAPVPADNLMDSLTKDFQSFDTVVQDDEHNAQVDEIGDLFGRLEAKDSEPDVNMST